MANLKTLIFLSALTFIQYYASAQTIGTFSSVEPMAQEQTFNIPSTHTFQRIIKTGDALTMGGTLGTNLDFTGYVPIGGSSMQGYLSISSESLPAGCGILDINFNSATKLWETTSSGNVDFTGFGMVAAFCSGTVTPWGNVIVGEENTPLSDLNADGYEDIGWFIEIEPATKTVRVQDGTGAGGNKDKIWAAGRVYHENIVIHSDQKTCYFGADHPTNGFIYKYVANTAGNLSAGTLYVLEKDAGSLTSSIGKWKLVSNGTKAERNTTVALSSALSATNFNGVEDVEIGPDGKIYFTAKSTGRVYRFLDNGTVGNTNDVVQFEVFFENLSYDVDGAGPFVPEAMGTGNDNLAFDGEGNLWVLQDGNRNHIWVVGAGHTAGGTNDVRLFATTPLGSEPTGITFTPDYKYMFISFQHPLAGNTAFQIDASGDTVVFNTHTTIVVSRKEFLGLLTSSSNKKSTIINGMNLYANPVSKELNIEFTSEKGTKGKFIICDESGKRILEWKVGIHPGKNAYSKDLNELPQGSYILLLESEEQIFTSRFVK